MMRKFIRLLSVASAAFFIASSALAQGTVTNHAFAIGKGPGVTGFTSLLCAATQIAIGQSSANPACFALTGDVTMNASGLTAIGSGKVLGAMLGAMTSAQLLAALSDETGTGVAVFATAPTLVNPVVGTQSPGDNTTKAASTAFVQAAVVAATAGVATLNGAAGAVTWSVSSQRITATGNTTYTPPAGFQYGRYILCAAGAGGGGAANASAGQISAGGGGGAGGCAQGTLSAATVGASKVITIPAGGAGGTAGANNGTAGADACITTTSCVSGQIIVAKGGSGGGGATTSNSGAGGAGGVAGTVQSTDAPAFTGANGSTAYSPTGLNTSVALVGAGASSPYGGGGAQFSFFASQTGNNCSGFSSGGSGGASSNAGGAAAGGNGCQGFFYIEEYKIN